MNTKNLVSIGIFAAIISILSIVAIPMPTGVPITLQTFAIALAGFVLGKKNGTLSVIIYVLLGIIGLPVFSGMTGGISRLFSPTGGFIFGFIFMSFFCGFANKNIAISLIYGLIGLFLCHLCGVIQFKFITGNSFITSIFMVSIPYLIKDIISIILAYIISLKIKKIIF